MSKRGLPRQELKSILGLGALRPNSSWGHYDKTLIGVTLLFNLIASSVAPLLTGSVSWLPSSRLYPLEPNAPQVDIPYFNRSSPLWTAYNRDVIFRRSILQMALGHSTQAWGREIDKDILKRSIPSTNGLQIGSRLTEVTLPYFSVNSIEWLEALPDNSTALDLLNKLISSVNSGPMENGDFRVIQGYVGLMPKARWPNSTTRPFPLPDIIQETQLAVFNLGLVKQTPMFFADSSYPTLYSTKISQYGFALVNYTAGIARCSNCNISSPSTVQSEKKFLSPEKDPMTREAMWLAPAVLSTLVTMNSSIPFPANCSLNDYATALLTRSYSASWSALTGMDGGISQNTTYAPAIPSLKAQVDFVRVYIWLVIQLLVTLSSICFLVIYAMTGSQIVGDTTLTGFYLDTSDVPVSGRAPVFKQGGVLRLRSKGDRLKVDVQSNR
ncbi:hypothetical protein OPQ81_008125 [Rhizoctonia solani]|nr:hypothetical protein OPQ81_008125 [Rhizoctonia solani]